MDFSPLIELQKQRLAKIAPRAKTPEAVESDEADEPDEYELFFTLVSDDGFCKSGKDLDAIWTSIVDRLSVDGNMPGAASKDTRPDVYKGM